jgi:enoyl-[acyl-carrier-protein] reductase (NADH)
MRSILVRGSSEEVGVNRSYVISDVASFVNGAILPVDGGRSVLGLDPEARAATP